MDCSLEQQVVEIPSIITGRDKTIHVKLRDNGRVPKGLFNPTEIVVILPNADGTTFLERKLSLSQIINVDTQNWEFDVLYIAADTALLKLSALDASGLPIPSDMELAYTMSGQTLGLNLPGVVNIVVRRYAAAP